MVSARVTRFLDLYILMVFKNGITTEAFCDSNYNHIVPDVERTPDSDYNGISSFRRVVIISSRSTYFPRPAIPLNQPENTIVKATSLNEACLDTNCIGASTRHFPRRLSLDAVPSASSICSSLSMQQFRFIREIRTRQTH